MGRGEVQRPCTLVASAAGPLPSCEARGTPYTIVRASSVTLRSNELGVGVNDDGSRFGLLRAIKPRYH